MQVYITFLIYISASYYYNDQCLGAGVGLTIHGGLSYNQRLVSVVTEVEFTGPGFMLGNLTAGEI